MKLINASVIAITLLLSNTALAAFTVSSEGFIDTAHNLEWLAPNNIQSLADYNAYVSSGWRVATSSNLQSILTNPLIGAPDSFSSFDQSIFDGFKVISNTTESMCGQALFCAMGWYSNQSASEVSYGYELGWIGLISQSYPAETNPDVVEQQRLNIETSFITSTIGSYQLYGYGNSYSTFMVRAVPLPDALLLFSSAILLLRGREFKRSLKRTSFALISGSALASPPNALAAWVSN